MPKQFFANRTAIGSDSLISDHINVVDPVTGLTSQKPIHITPDEERDRTIRDLKRGLESVDYRAATVDEYMPWQEPPSAEVVAQRRLEFENERQFILSELERLGAPVEEPAAKRRKR
jgi:hypothetical protein